MYELNGLWFHSNFTALNLHFFRVSGLFNSAFKGGLYGIFTKYAWLQYIGTYLRDRKICENIKERKTTSHSFGAYCYIRCRKFDDILYNFKTMFIVTICVLKMQFVLHIYVMLEFNITKW